MFGDELLERLSGDVGFNVLHDELVVAGLRDNEIVLGAADRDRTGPGEPDLFLRLSDEDGKSELTEDAASRKESPILGVVAKVRVLLEADEDIARMRRIAGSGLIGSRRKSTNANVASESRCRDSERAYKRFEIAVELGMRGDIKVAGNMSEFGFSGGRAIMRSVGCGRGSDNSNSRAGAGREVHVARGDEGRGSGVRNERSDQVPGSAKRR